jgi:ferrous iron transport protein B
VLKGDDAPFVMELPPYRLPTLRAVWLKMLERSWMYLRKAGTVILGISIVLWFLTAFPLPSRYQVDLDIESGVLTEISQEEIESRRTAEGLQYSVAGRFGRTLEPVFAPLGFDWKTVTAMVGAFAAKEVFVSQLAIVYSMAGEEEDSENLRGALARDYSPIAGISMILFLLIATPCMATFAITRKETGHIKWAFLQFFGLTVIAYLVALVVFQVGSLLL